MAILFVNSTGANVTASASTWSLALPAVTLGNALVIGIGVGSSSVQVSTVTDNAGSLYVRAARAVSPRPVAGAEIWYATNVSNTSTRVSVTLSANSSGGLASAQFSGFSTNRALGPTGSTASATLSTVYNVATITPGTSGVAVMFARLNVSTIGTLTVGGGQTAWISTNTCAHTFGQYIIQTAADSTNGAFTTSSRALHAGAIAYFYDTNTLPVGGASPSLTMLGMQ
jgi:hypothetical protein